MSSVVFGGSVALAAAAGAPPPPACPTGVTFSGSPPAPLNLYPGEYTNGDGLPVVSPPPAVGAP